MTPNRESANQPAGKLETLGSFRDGLLVLASMLYGVGYAVWSYHAWRHNLGPRSGLDFQYFVARIVPSLALGLLCLVVIGYTRLRRLISSHLGADSRGWKRFLRWAIFVLFALSFLSVMLLTNDWLVSRAPRSARWALTAAGSVFIGTMCVLPPAGMAKRAKRPAAAASRTSFLAAARQLVGVLEVYRVMGIGYFYFSVLLIFGGGVFLFISEVYPKVPQEFGGVRPRCAFLDLAASELAPETLKAIAAKQLLPLQSTADKLVVRTEKLSVLLATGEVLLVSHQPQGGDISKLPVYEIKRDVVRALTWCDPR